MAPRSKQCNILLPIDQYEWLREHAHRTRRPQAEIVREALAAYRERTAAPIDAAGEDHVAALMEIFADGRGVDLELLKESDARIWGLEP